MRWLDGVLAAALAGCLVAGTFLAQSAQTHVRTLDAVGIVLIVVAAGVTVGPRRVAPEWALAGGVAAVSAYLLAGYPYGSVQLCMVIGMFEVARLRPPRISLPLCGIAAVVASVTLLVRVAPDASSPALLALAWTGWIVLPWSLGALGYTRRVARDRERRDLVARAAIEERMRIAAEVHDVAGHGFAVVAMQAGVALVVFDEQPDQVRASLEAIKAASAESLAGLRGMLDAVARDRTGLAGVPELVERVRAGGLPVELELERMEPGGEIDGEIDMVAFRVVQESLTNVLRHAGPTRAEVRVARDGTGVVVEVKDRGRGTPGPPGRGLDGMRRRVEAAGGTLVTGPRDGGGFAVLARLPGGTR
ncbi:MAG: sensor histidine kinase [Actinophytocola sp.]|uniref:sensor histidine kinase n=1 Tax=Actinophytocola sp. TaxID=1872138 RepID=UPI001322DFC2|nr:histidine kinase [Actinophytocola sp.]MPZ84993.1 sensor histidine kinase [Actinophytocola sp.]